MKKRFIVLISTLLIIAFGLVPFSVSAEEISWTNVNYMAYAEAEIYLFTQYGTYYEGGNSSIDSEPPLPVTASAEVHSVTGWDWGRNLGEAYSQVTSSSMFLDINYSYGCIPNCPGYFYGTAYAEGEFSGRYTAEFLNFGFSYQNSTNDSHLLSLSLYDYTDSAYLFNQALGGSNGTIDIATAVDHDIGVEVHYSIYGDGYDYVYDGSKQNTLTYNMDAQGVPVVPEPISSTLFIVGGAVFAGRRFLRRAKV